MVRQAACVGVLVVAALVLLVGCTGDQRSSGSASGSARADSSARPSAGTQPATADAPDSGFPTDWVPTPLRWSRCELPREGRCATLAVPLDWSDPEGSSIELAVGRIPARGARTGALLINPGGPGASGLEFLSFDPVSDTLADQFDLVSWDPRGVGASAPLSCGDDVGRLRAADPDPDTEDEQAELDAAAASIASDCAASDAALLPHLGTRDVARDMEAIRRALGGEQLNYLGFSYGTQIGQQYAQMFPGRIRAMALDAVVDPDQGFEEFLLGQAVAFEDSFAISAAGCAAAGTDECGVEDLGDAYDRVRAMVERSPLRGGDEPVGPSALATATILSNYGAEGWTELGPALAAALEGDGGPLWELAASYYELGGFTSYAAVVCTDTAPPAGADAYRAFADEARDRAPRFGGSVANELAPCATWPADAIGVPSPVTAAGAPPILVIGNTGDPATPYRNAVDVAASLESGVLVTVESDGHTAYLDSTCVTAIVDDYLVALEVPQQDTVCSS